MVLRSPVSDIEIRDVPLHEFVLEDTGRRADKPALIDGPSGRTITYGELTQQVHAFAAGLAARGLEPGEVVGIFSPNLPEYAVAFHGIARAGGTVTTVNPTSTAKELGRQLSDAGARFLLTAQAFAETAVTAAEDSGVEQVFVFGEAEGLSPVTELMGDPDDAPEVSIDPAEHLVALPFSSGTTGLPKGVMLTHRNLVANVQQSVELLETTEDDVVIGVLPFFHIYGMTVILNLALRNGATVVTMPRFDLQQFLELHQEHGITQCYAVPPIVLALAKQPVIDQFDLSALNFVMCGAAPLSQDLSEAASERLGCTVIQGYGMTETSPVTHVSPLERNKPGTVGVLLPNTEAKIVDVDTGEPVETGDRGELLVRGPQIMAGYLNNQDATDAMIDEDGWLSTGDIAVVDEEGYFSIVDRVKELIKYKGYQVPPAELEALLLEHDQIDDAGVIGRPDEEAGELPVAFVVAEGLEPDAVLSYVAERVAPYKRLRGVEFVDEIPKSASGKILRRELAKLDDHAGE
ncbi:MAG: 4-coumarate--CoA ligase family protein [Actinobacteria bacterium]|nr:4-coumarate--CoA ligase family protein [Actinomycetota bacterium]